MSVLFGLDNNFVTHKPGSFNIKKNLKFVGFLSSFSLIVYFTTTTRRTFQIGLNNTQVPGHKVWKWSSGVNLTNDLLMPFSLNNFDGNMRDCSVGHCGVFEVKADYVGVFDNCCSKVSFWCICSRYVRQNQICTSTFIEMEKTKFIMACFVFI